MSKAKMASLHRKRISRTNKPIRLNHHRTRFLELMSVEAEVWRQFRASVDELNAPYKIKPKRFMWPWRPSQKEEL